MREIVSAGMTGHIRLLQTVLLRLLYSMDEKPPVLDPDPDRPPEGYASYPRGGSALPSASPEKLEALMDGYYGLNWVFLWFVLIGVAGVATIVTTEASPAGIAIGLLLMFLAVAALAVLSYPCAKKIGYGLGWSSSTPLLISILIGVGTIVVSPLIPVAILQIIAMGGIKGYGIKGGFFGVRKKDIKAKILELRSESSASPQVPFQP